MLFLMSVEGLLITLPSKRQYKLRSTSSAHWGLYRFPLWHGVGELPVLPEPTKAANLTPTLSAHCYCCWGLSRLRA